MVETTLRQVNLLYRDPAHPDQGHEGFLPRDVIEISDPPVYVIDPKTRQPLAELQCFQFGPDGVVVRPVRRGSWL